MSLACTLRLPLENIRVTNITLTDALGIRTVINAERFFLSSNGTVRCYVVGSVSGSDGRTPSLRRLQATSGTQAQVDYYIVDPPTDVLALTSTEFSAVMESSSSLADLSASVGSSGVLALSEASLSTAAMASNSGAASVPASGSSKAESNSAVIGGVVGAVAMATLVVAGAIGFSQARKRAHAKFNITRSGSVHVVQHTINPVGASPARISPTQLHIFSAGSTRGPMAFDAMKTRTSV